MSINKRNWNSASISSAPLPLLLGDTTRHFSWLREKVLRLKSAFFTGHPRRIGVLVEFGRFVWIEHTEHAADLHSMGVFGKGTLSRSEPTWAARMIKNADDQSPDKKTYVENITNQRRMQRRQQSKQKKGLIKASDDDRNEANDVWDTDELLACIGTEKDHESLQLDLFEAFFLLYGLNALEIYTAERQRLSVDACWTLFCQLYNTRHQDLMLNLFSHATDNEFVLKYTAYHYYRSLGWIPKAGTKFGVDFVMYRRGPKFYHADFAVIVLSDQNRQLQSWKALLASNRICSQVKKTLILCYIIHPTTPSVYDVSNPNILREYKVREVIFKRWSPERNRE
ncbi:uncharacterized protein BYT42DRAFT_607680 [Radiomyces spectabilis]|uniref:uncharacterized protein n=1 Tax=Radiomyces spectabilis TaxID=64574 RepID=UPI0022210AA8|nr:uncharacterized protein BYT42DRAFT_607680 [Radiomyces spectabilis]KAI8370725.1 hypothetical protein BYT42DRAFT_607680 [Radiomyces spectabilis]